MDKIKSLPTPRLWQAGEKQKVTVYKSSNEIFGRR